MGRRIGDKLIEAQFGKVEVHQQLNLANKKIESLTAEIEGLRRLGKKDVEQKKVQELHASLKKQGVVILDVDNIEPNPAQPRQTFTEESLILLARSLENDGQQQPILVFQKSESQYFLFDGERRLRATKKLGRKEINAVIIPLYSQELIKNPEKLRRQALLANHHRENINPLDLAESLVKEIASFERISVEDSPRILNTVITRLNRQDKLKILSDLVLEENKKQTEVIRNWKKEGILNEQETCLLSFLLTLGLNPTSVKNNIFPTLKLHQDLKDAIREKGLGGHHARVLQKISIEVIGKQATAVRKRLTNEVIQKKLSVAQTRKLVSAQINKKAEPNKLKKTRSIAQFVSSMKQVKVNELNQEDLKTLKVEMSQKLQEIELILEKLK